MIKGSLHFTDLDINLSWGELKACIAYKCNVY